MSDLQTIVTTKRLLKDVKQIMKHPLIDNGIYYIHDDSDMTKGYAMIVGPSDTPYFGGYYFFAFSYPSNYPFFPPTVTYMTNNELTRFNPNLYKCGKVCVSILNTWSGEQWSSCQTINSVLLTLCSLLNNFPLLNEPGQNKKSSDFIPYQKSIEFSNIDFAICDMINPLKNAIPEKFQIFYPYMKQIFTDNYDKILEFVKSQPREPFMQVVRIYEMSTYINYAMLEKKIIEIKKIIDCVVT